MLSCVIGKYQKSTPAHAHGVQIFVLLLLKAPLLIFVTITPYLKSNPPALKRRECTTEWKAALCTISQLASI